MQCLTQFLIVCASLFGVVDDPPNSEREEQLYSNFESYREDIEQHAYVREVREVRLFERTPAHIAEVQAIREQAREEQEARRYAARQAARAAERARLEEIERVQAEAEAAAEVQARIDRYGSWTLPTSNYRITGTFGASGSNWSNRHTGLDFAAPAGTEIVAIGNGEITFAGGDGAYGNKIEIRHDDGTVSWYGHMRAFERTSGEVAAGDVIGYVGSTGNSTGPHVHLEIRIGGELINPASFLRDKGLNP